MYPHWGSEILKPDAKVVKNDKITDEWNALNILSTDAATVGNIDLGIINNENNLIKDIELHTLQTQSLNPTTVDMQFIKLLKAGLKLVKKRKYLVFFLHQALGKKIVLSALIKN